MNHKFILGGLALMAGLWAPLGVAQDMQKERLDIAADWLNQAQKRSSDPMLIQTLSMDEPNYRLYVASAYGEEASSVGNAALAAFYQSGALVDGQRRDVCFLLYNPAAKNILADQFVLPYEKAHGEALAPHLFLAAHELGHCLDFRARLRGAKPRRGVLMEAVADVFAIKVLLNAGIPNDHVHAIVESRRRSGPSHATWSWAAGTLQKPLSSPRGRSIEEVWKKADEELSRP
jgi:hypothetical protein